MDSKDQTTTVRSGMSQYEGITGGKWLQRNRVKRRFRTDRFLIMFCVFFLSIFVFLLLSGSTNDSPSINGELHERFARAVDGTDSSNVTTTTTEDPDAGLGREDAFSMKQLKQGAVILYVFGVIYMFIALAVVCDEFFVPSLEVITVKFAISQDVAGATFMAAGGSAPELFTSFIGVFLLKSNVGIGTIVGSAVFNILFVIGMCGIFSHGVLQLTWWPLFRDVFFYSISLICLIGFFVDQTIEWWESLILLLCYIAYVLFMKFNRKIEMAVKSKLPCTQKNKVTTVRSSDNLIMEMQNTEGGGGHPNNPASATNKFRQGVVQLMIHTIDPLGEAKFHEKASQLHAIASLKNALNGDNNNSNGSAATNGSAAANGSAPTENGSTPAVNGSAPSANGSASSNGSRPIQVNVQPAENGKVTSVSAISNGQLTGHGHNGGANGGIATPPERNISQQTNVTMVTIGSGDTSGTSSPHNLIPDAVNTPPEEEEAQVEIEEEGFDEESEPMDLSWPDTWKKRLVYIIIAPIVFPLWVTLPDVRKPTSQKWFPITFIGSIVWIAIFAYLMNWWAAVVGLTIGIPASVMGLTLLAAGTSIPDLITSVIVAKKGYGDMAVSSSVGSNIFDITVGLPLPWILYSLIYSEAYAVNSEGLFCSIILLFAMLVMIIIIIAALKWKMGKSMGFIMLALYGVFLAIALLLEYSIIPCFHT